MASGSVEDHLTEFIAAALAMNSHFRKGFAEKLLANHSFSPIATIETQACFPLHGCIPDMLLTLEDGRVILCENKIEAIETLGKDESKGQLEKYLKLPVDGVAYIRGSWKPPDAKVLEHPKYIKPATREHFLWRDFYDLLMQDDVFLQWLRQGFENMGYTPPLPPIGDLNDPDENKRFANQKEFAKLWSLTRTNLRELGWRSETGSTIELYLENNSSKWSHQYVFICPSPAERFIIRITPREGHTSDIVNAVKEVIAPIPV